MDGWMTVDRWINDKGGLISIPLCSNNGVVIGPILEKTHGANNPTKDIPETSQLKDMDTPEAPKEPHQMPRGSQN